MPINDDDDVITVTPDLDPSKVTGPITTAELQAALSTSRLSSSSGPARIPVIALWIKEFRDDILNTINQLSKMVDSEFDKIHLNGSIRLLCLFPKMGLYSLDNQLRIATSCAISKIQYKIIFNRIKSVAESKLLGLQSGFRSGRSTTEQIMMLRFLLDAARTQKRSLTIVFVDYSKVLDSVDRKAILVFLRHYSIPDQAVADVMQLYHGSTAVVSWFHRSCIDPLRIYRKVRYHQWCSARGYPVASPLSCWSTSSSSLESIYYG